MLVSAFRSRDGASYRLLRFLLEGRFTAVATPSLIFEYEDVLKRLPQRQAQGLTDELLEAAFGDLVELIEPVRIDFQWKPQLRDADDEFVLEAATNGHAYAIVPHNVRDFLPEAERLGVRIVTPGGIIRERFS